MKGIITHIQRMSIHDGPGIRSTVFLKGCNLRCKWCHNPETWQRNIQLYHIQEKCIACKECIQMCQTKAISIEENRIMINRNKCTACGVCTRSCITGALTVTGKAVEAEEIINKLLEDKPFFDESGGGITLSGGEPTLQKEFALEILKNCQSVGIHTAVETNLTTRPETVESFLPHVNLWMCDLKTANPETHRQWTGQSNKKIIENLKLLSLHKAPVILRTPIIPDVNDTPADIESICELVRQMDNIICYELLGFHPLGFSKFQHLGMENPMPITTFLSKEKGNELKEIPLRYGIKNKFNN